MTTYYNISTGDISSRPKSNRTSNLWLNEEKLLEEGWLPVVEDAEPVLAFGERVTGNEFVVRETDVLRRKTVARRTLAEQKEWMKQRGKGFVEGKLAEKYGVFEALARALGNLGAGAKTALEDDLTTWVAAYSQYASDVDGASTWAALETVRNNYPQLQEDF